MMFRDACKGHLEWRSVIAPSLRDQVIPVAMKRRRAPLRVCSALWKGLLRKGFPNDLNGLAILTRRYFFLGDARILLAELRIRTATTTAFMVKADQDMYEQKRGRSRPRIAAGPDDHC